VPQKRQEERGGDIIAAILGKELPAMPLVEIEYQIGVSDFRKASYYGLFLRQRRALLIFFAVLLVSALYAAGAAIGLGKVNLLVFFLAAAYLVWALFLFAGEERQIGAYLRREDNLLGETFRMRMDDKSMRMEIPSRGVSFSRTWERLACAFELSDLFLLYLTPQDVYLLPKRVLRPEEIAALRQTLRLRLGDRFGTRFLPKKR